MEFERVWLWVPMPGRSTGEERLAARRRPDGWLVVDELSCWSDHVGLYDLVRAVPRCDGDWQLLDVVRAAPRWWFWIRWPGSGSALRQPTPLRGPARACARALRRMGATVRDGRDRLVGSVAPPASAIRAFLHGVERDGAEVVHIVNWAPHHEASAGLDRSA
jgi:hypothetical protein